MPPCLTLRIIRHVSRVKWSNPGKEIVPSPTPRCSSYWKGSLLVALANFTFTLQKVKSLKLNLLYLFVILFLINTASVLIIFKYNSLWTFMGKNRKRSVSMSLQCWNSSRLNNNNNDFLKHTSLQDFGKKWIMQSWQEDQNTIGKWRRLSVT